jgi:hypothetical protein
VADGPNNAAAKIVEKHQNGIVIAENKPQLYANEIGNLLTKQKSEVLPNSSFKLETLSSAYIHEWEKFLL